MSKRRVTRAAPADLGQVAPTDFNWNACIFCQNDNGDLSCPAHNPVQSRRNLGYTSLAINLTELLKYDYTLDCGKNVNVLDEGYGIEATFIERQARWHRKCALQYQSPKFENLVEILKENLVKNQTTTSSGPATESLARPATRSSSTPVGINDEICLFCTGPATRQHSLTHVQTKEFTVKVKMYATALCDTRIIGIIETCGDFIALEAKYHKRCYATLANRYRKLSRTSDDTEKELLCERIAFADLVIYIEGKLNVKSEYVFDMSDIMRMYKSRIADLQKTNEENVNLLHSTRLRTKILDYFPELVAEKWGKKYILRRRTANLMYNISSENQDEDAVAYHRFALSLRKCIDTLNLTFDGKFDENCEEKSIPGPLLAVMSTLLYGSSTFNPCNASRPLLTICQLIILNCQKSAPTGHSVRHKRSLETPLPLYLGLACFGRSRDKKWITEMHNKGISVSSERVLEVSSQLCRLAVARAEEEQLVCPSNLRKGLFTVTALDNIDVHASSNLSVTEFHGTGISVFQNRQKENQGQVRQFTVSFTDVYRKGDRSVPALPEWYNTAQEWTLSHDKPVPGDTYFDCSLLDMVSSGHTSVQWKKEKSWLNSVYDHLSNASTSDSTISWSAFHAAEQSQTESSSLPAINALLPLFHDKSASVPMIRHGINLVMKLTEYLNPGQQAVICFDLQLYIIAKKIQWQWPDLYSENKLVVLLGPLHIEQAFLRMLGSYMEGCGWNAIITHSGIATSGSSEALLKVTHIKRAREVHQVTAAVLHTLLIEEYNSHPHEDIEFEQWIDERAKNSPTFLFWFTLLNLEIMLLDFVRSVRLGQYNNFKDALKAMVPWFFVFDHTNYARWLPVHIFDLEQLENTCPNVHKSFLEGHFVVNKTNNLFSCLGIDHALEQNNASVKGKGGISGLSHDPSALRRWTIGGPEITRILNEFEHCEAEEDDETGDFGCHHEQKDSYQMRFLQHCIALKDSFLEFDNPFAVVREDLIALDTRVAISAEGVSALVEAETKESAVPTFFVSGNMRTGDKAKLTLILEKLGQPEDAPTQVNAVIIDGGCLVHAVKPRQDLKTFTQYVKQLQSVITSMASTFKVSRVDIAWDRYFKDSLKAATRTERGCGVRRVELPQKDKLPLDWADYLRNDENKVELFRYLSQSLLECCEGFEMVTNIDSQIISSAPGSSMLHEACAEMEEADGRIVLHLHDMVVHGGIKTVVVRSSDTDVVVLLISFFPELRDRGLEKVWVSYGVGLKRRYINIHAISASLGDDKSVALRGFHALTVCEMTAFFGSKGNPSAWGAWTSEETTQAFKIISVPQREVQENTYATLEKFVVGMYGVDSDKPITQARKELFASEYKHISAIPPSKAALGEKIKRAAYIAGHLWGSSSKIEGPTMSPEGWGFTYRAGWKMVWTSLPDV
ncbi:hypothetical protein FOCC_FOCC015307 [Frankliniella occidentalis]|nr:hypothetical protein FOCC_FOCC015307 [Frankliniella occidentalis]